VGGPISLHASRVVALAKAAAALFVWFSGGTDRIRRGYDPSATAEMMNKN
jgi:hypothetical protein